MAMSMPSTTNAGFLLQLSIYMTAVTFRMLTIHTAVRVMDNVLVAMNVTMPITPVAGKLTEFDDSPSPLKMVGA